MTPFIYALVFGQVVTGGNPVNESLIIDDLGCAATQTIRRNAGDTAWECFTPGVGLGSYTSWTLSGDAGAETIGDLNTATFLGDNDGIDTLAFATDKILFTIDESEITLTGDVDSALNANDLDEANVEVELEGVLDLLDLQDGAAADTCTGDQIVKRNAGDTAFECAAAAASTDVTLPVESGVSFALHEGAYFDTSGTEFTNEPEATYTSEDAPGAGVVIACSLAGVSSLFPCTAAAGESVTVRTAGTVTGVDTLTMAAVGNEGFPVCLSGAPNDATLSFGNCGLATGRRRVVAWIQIVDAATGVLRVLPEAAGRQRIVVAPGITDCNNGGVGVAAATDGAFKYGDICIAGTNNKLYHCESADCYGAGWVSTTATPADNTVTDLELLTSGAGTANQILRKGGGTALVWADNIHSRYFPAGACRTATPVVDGVWSWGATFPTATCHTPGAGSTKATLDFDNVDATDQEAQTTLKLPNQWRAASAIDVVYGWFGATGATNPVAWCAQIICTTTSAQDDPTFPALATTNCISDAGDATANDYNVAIDTGVSYTGCLMDEVMHIRISRDSAGSVVADTYADTARLIGVELRLVMDPS